MSIGLFNDGFSMNHKIYFNSNQLVYAVSVGNNDSIVINNQNEGIKVAACSSLAFDLSMYSMFNVGGYDVLFIIVVQLYRCKLRHIQIWDVSEYCISVGYPNYYNYINRIMYDFKGSSNLVFHLHRDYESWFKQCNPDTSIDIFVTSKESLLYACQHFPEGKLYGALQIMENLFFGSCCVHCRDCNKGLECDLSNMVPGQVYRDCNSTLKFKCSTCDYEYESAARLQTQRNGCPNCSNSIVTAANSIRTDTKLTNQLVDESLADEYVKCSTLLY